MNMFRSLFFLLIASLFISTLAFAQKHNFIVILADDLGTDKISVYGNELGISQPQTPILTRLFKEGIQFQNAYSHVFCSPSRLSLMTGKHPHNFGVGIFIRNKDPRQIGLPTDLINMPKALSSLGYDTSHVGKWHMASPSVYQDGQHPLKAGFKWSSGPGRNILSYTGSKKYKNGEEQAVPGYALSDKIDDAIGRTKQMKQPWLLYLPFNTPHHPFHVPPKDLLNSTIPKNPSSAQKYDLMVEAMDTEIGRLISSIPQDVLSNTTVIFMGDNGTPSDGVENKPQGPQRMKGSVYQGGVHVPLLVWGSAVAKDKKGTPNDNIISITDIFPTIFELAGGFAGGLELTGKQALQEIDGVSFAQTVSSKSSKESSTKRETIMSERFEPNGPPPYRLLHRMVRNQTHKLIEKRQHGRLKAYEFYNTELDTGEKNNLCPSLEACSQNLVESRDREQYKKLKQELDIINKKAAAAVITIDPDPESQLTTKEFRKKKKRAF